MKHGTVSTSLTVLFFSCSAFALDTMEPFAPGFSDAELYLGVENVGESRAQTTPLFAGGVGAGLTERLSLFVGYAANADGYLSQASHGVDVSLYGNLGTWGPWAFDLGATLAEGAGSLQAGPFLELNWDLTPEQTTAGLYLRGGPTAAGAGAAVDWNWEQGLGGYYTVGEDKQLFLEWGTGYDLGRTPAQRAWQRGTLSLGFNWVVSDTLELITEAGVTLPRSSEASRCQASVGFVATLPGTR
jgi:hypothetical protein